jgi:hypothetical protein
MKCKICSDSGRYTVTVGLSPIGDIIELKFCKCKSGQKRRSESISYQEGIIKREKENLDILKSR